MTTRLALCCIYYRVAAPHAAAARASIRAAQLRLAERAGIVGRLYEGENEPLLWMEVYEHVRDTQRFEAMLNDLLAADRFAQFLASDSPRRLERIVDQAP